MSQLVQGSFGQALHVDDKQVPLGARVIPLPHRHPPCGSCSILPAYAAPILPVTMETHVLLRIVVQPKTGIEPSAQTTTGILTAIKQALHIAHRRLTIANTAPSTEIRPGVTSASSSLQLLTTRPPSPPVPQSPSPPSQKPSASSQSSDLASTINPSYRQSNPD
ncbi:hypothetical protein BKA56DRAFT_621638 [Ilyonectria sp. MPI-CAGE-AT-0026]|nr:hypothetical protein BKA56DRAFT_621638 [Ilyonectria sp. MPI-CAGE-AT-0026]